MKQNYEWLKEHIDIWYKILVDRIHSDKRKVEGLTTLIKLVKEELEEDDKK